MYCNVCSYTYYAVMFAVLHDEFDVCSAAECVVMFAVLYSVL